MVNCQKDAVISSGVAYYKQLRDGGAWGEQPDDYVDTSHGVYTNWEIPGHGMSRNAESLYRFEITDRIL